MVQVRSTEMRRSLLQAAAAEFDDRGYAGATIQGIADKLGKSKGALSYHFPSKASFASGIVEAFYRQVPAIVEPYREDGSFGIGSLIAVCLEVAQRFRDDVMVRAAVRIQREAKVVEIVLPTPYIDWLAITEVALRGARERGQVLPGLDLQATARVLVSGFFGTQQVANDLGRRVELVDWMVDMWRIVLPGIVGAESQTVLEQAMDRVRAHSAQNTGESASEPA